MEQAASGFRLLYANCLALKRSWRLDAADPFWRIYRNEQAGMQVAGIALPPGRLCLLPPFRRSRGHAPAGLRHAFAHLDLPGVPAEWLERTVPPLLILPPDPRLELRFAALAATERQGLRWQLQMQGLCAEILGLAWQQLDPAAVAELDAGVVERAAVRPALHFIEDHLASPLTPARLAKTCELSVHHFGRVFRRAVGETPGRYIQRRRIEVAAERLRRGERSIEAVAAAVGFANRFHFSRVFARQIGEPPAAYRDRQHGGAAS